MRIGFIGLGNMGLPMAANLVRAGHSVMGYDVNTAAIVAHEAAGGHGAGSIAEAMAEAEMVFTMLPTGRHVEAVYCDESGILKNISGAALLVDCSTIDVATARRVGAGAGAQGLPMLDAPVSGGTTGATAATLTFMVGGAAAAFALARPVLEAMGRTIVHAGESGAGQAAKICNNMMLAINMIGAAEAVGVADRLGLDRAKLFEISSNSSGQSWAFSRYNPAPDVVAGVPAGRGYTGGFATSLMLKDLLLAQAAAEETNAPTPLGAHAARIYQAVADAGEAGLDFSVVFRWLSAQARSEVS